MYHRSNQRLHLGISPRVVNDTGQSRVEGDRGEGRSFDDLSLGVMYHIQIDEMAKDASVCVHFLCARKHTARINKLKKKLTH